MSADEGHAATFAKLSAKEVRRLWDLKILSPASYLYLLILAKRKKGWRFRIKSAREFCKVHAIARATFHRAITQLEEAGLIQAEIIGAIDLFLCSPDDQGWPKSGPVAQIRAERPKSGPDGPDLGQPPPEAQSPRGFAPPYRSLTYLSQEQTENFDFSKPEYLAWLRQVAQALPKPPAAIEAWIAKYATDPVYQQSFTAIEEAKALKEAEEAWARESAAAAEQAVENLTPDQKRDAIAKAKQLAGLAPPPGGNHAPEN